MTTEGDDRIHARHRTGRLQHEQRKLERARHPMDEHRRLGHSQLNSFVAASTSPWTNFALYSLAMMAKRKAGLPIKFCASGVGLSMLHHGLARALAHGEFQDLTDAWPRHAAGRKSARCRGEHRHLGRLWHV